VNAYNIKNAEFGSTSMLSVIEFMSRNTEKRSGHHDPAV
jgi:hypothetical protein